jgi:tungstate transport system ATP-binding protein
MTADRPIVAGNTLKIVRGKSTILDVARLDVNEGEFLSVVGPNGAGKTSLLQTLAFLANPFEGSILFRGLRVGIDCPVMEYRRAIAMAFQEPLLFDTTVEQNVASGLRIRHARRSTISETVSEYLDLFSISHLRNRSARSLSGGEAQRTNLARAFATRPDVMFLDEPFASLDPGSKEPLMDDIQRVLRRTRTTVILVTHDLMEALRLSDRIAVMDRGRILQIDTPDEVMNRPATESVASFVGAGTVLTGIVRENRGETFLVSINGRSIESSGSLGPGEQVSLYIRPENVTLSVAADKEHRALENHGDVEDHLTGRGLLAGLNMEPDPGRERLTSARNLFRGTVTRITTLGFCEKVHLDCGFPLTSYITRESREDLRLQEGGVVLASFKATAIHVIPRSS